MKKLLLILLFLLPAVSAVMTVSAATATGTELSEPHANDGLSAKAVTGGLQLEVTHDHDATARFLIYSITGQMVKSVDVPAGTTVLVELPAGYYIVKTAIWSLRLVVR